MATTLGLDLGTNSIGWALINDEKPLIKAGVRIFPVGVKEDDFQKNGKEVSKNVDRRTLRGARRRRHRYKLRREKLSRLLEQHSMLPGEEDFFSTRELYDLRVKGLDKRLTLIEFGRILTMLNKRRGFKSNKKTLATEEAKKEEGIVKESILKLQEQLDTHKCRTVGEYFALLFKEGDKQADWPSKDTPIARIRDRFVGREMYIKEFNLLWERQTSYYPTVLTPELRTIIRDETIYYQRNLKSQKGMVGRCRFEPNKRCAPRSSALFQEFRIWQQLSLVRFINGDRVGQELTAEEKQKVCAVLMKKKKISATELKKLLDIPRSDSFNDVFNYPKDCLKGNLTRAMLAEALGDALVESLNEQQRFELWHVLTYTDNTEKLKTIVQKKISQGILPSLSDEAIVKYAEINLEDGYGNFSTKALNNILPYLRKGLAPFDAFNAAGYNPSRKIIRGKSEELFKIPPLASNELRNPIVQQMLSETFRVVNALVKEYGKPDIIRVELARELKKPKDKREEARNNAIRKRTLREEYAEFLSKRMKKRIEPNSPEIRKYELWLEMGCDDPKLDDLDSFIRHGKIKDQLKYRLWRECNRISPYSGKPISLTKLFSPDIQIEHILPYSKTMNNEFTNLCLCEVEINKDKGDKLPYNYFKSKGEKAFEEFKNRVAVFGEGKQRRFLAKEIPEDFLNSQLTNTSYAARELAARLEMLLPPIQDGETLKPRVQVANGQATAVLRRLWGLNSILSKGDIDTKNRGDHRHHAIDAITVACTTPALMHTLAKYSKFDVLNKLDNDHIMKPWRSFLTDTSNAINSIIVSYRNQKRLVGKKPNKTKAMNLEKYPNGYSRSSSISIRGTLHEETIYGSINANGDQSYVTRWLLEKFTDEKQLDKVVDPIVRKVLKARIKKYGGVKKAFENLGENPVLMYSEKGFRVPIRRVRVFNPGEHLVEVRPNAFVETGNNYAIAIYRDGETRKSAHETVSFFSAVQKSLRGETFVPKEKNGLPLLYVLKQRDIVVRYDKDPDEIDWDNMDYLRSRLFRVRKFDINGIICLDYLYTAKIDKKDRNRLFFDVVPNTLHAVRVEVDVLGNIVRKEGV